MTHEKTVVASALHKYVATNLCPCNWPQFEYWVSKPQGPGWQDEIQNTLIESLLELRNFERTQPKVPEFGLVDELHCFSCGVKWKHYSHEWRMLAFQERLIRLDKPSPDVTTFVGFIGANIFATLGQEPIGAPSLTLDQWSKFMEGKTFHAVPFGSSAPQEASNKTPFLRRLVNTLENYRRERR
jgi:hypothetical protein